jgi:diacylglycerol kinase family enzyme
MVSTAARGPLRNVNLTTTYSLSTFHTTTKSPRPVERRLYEGHEPCVASECMHTETRRAEVIINARSGTARKEAAADRVSEYLASRGIAARVELVRHSEELPEAAARAAASDADIVVAGGGDGTIAAVASGLLDTPKALGVLPLGTFNYFARRVGVPLELDGALEVIATTTAPQTVSVGEVNGRVFLNNSSIGLYPAVLKQRETTYRRIGRSQAAAYLSVAFVLIQPPAFLNLRLTADGVALVRRTPLVFVGVNPHQMAIFGIPGYECLEDGRLAMYITRPLSTTQLWRLALRAFFRGLYGASELEVVCAGELHVTLRSSRVRVAMDGEVASLHTPLRYRLRVNALRVLAGPTRQSVHHQP